MPYRRRRRVRRRVFRRSTVFRRFGNRRIGVPLLRERRMCCGIVPITFSTTATANFWKYVAPSLDNGIDTFQAVPTIVASLTNKAEYAALFDQYKLSAWKIKFVPKYQDYNLNQGGAAAPTAGIDVPMLCIVKDPYSTLTPTGTWNQSTLNTLLEQGGKVYRADKPVTVYMRPKVTEQYGGGANRYISPRYTDLTTTAGTTMPHRGFHMFAFNTTWNNAALSQNAWDVYITYYLSFKNPK